MASDGKIKVVAELDAKTYLKALSGLQSSTERTAGAVERTLTKSGANTAGQLTKSTDQATNTIGSKFSALGESVKGVFIGIGASFAQNAISTITSSIDDAVQRVDVLNRFPKIMQSFGYSSEDGAKAIKRLADGVTGLPTSLQDIASATQSFIPFSKSVSEATDVTLALNDAIVAGGASTAVQSSAIEQYRQALAKGKPQLQDWRTLQQAMPGQLQQIAKELGVGSGALKGYSADSMGLYEALKNGDLTMTDLNNAIVRLDKQGGNGFKSFKDQALDASGGINTGMANARLAVQRGIAEIIQAIGAENISDRIKRGGEIAEKALRGIAGIIRELKPLVEDIVEFVQSHPTLTKVAVGAIVAVQAGGRLNKALDSLSAKYGTVSKLASAVGKALGNSLSGSQLSNFIGLLGKAGKGVSNLVKNLPSLVSLLGGGFVNAIKSAGTAISTVGALAAANPIGAVITVIALVIGALVLLYNKCEWFRNGVNAIIKAIGGFIQGAIDVVGPVISGFIEGIKNVISGIVGFVSGVVKGIISAIQTIGKVLQPIFEFVQNVVIFLVAIITNLIQLVVVGVIGALQTLWNNVLVPLWNFIWGTILQPLVNFLGATFGALINVVVGFIQGVWSTVTEVWNGIVETLSAVGTWLNENLIQPIKNFFGGLFDGIRQRFEQEWQVTMQVLGQVGGWINENVIQPIKNFFGGMADWLKTNVIDKVAGFFQRGWDAVKRGAEALKDGIKNIFSTLVGIIKKPINAIIRGVNGVIDAMNSLTIPDWVPGLGGKHANFKKFKELASGGYVYGVGTATSDSNPALLSRGEYVVRADTVKRYGVAFMDALNEGRLASVGGGGGMTQNYYYQFDRGANSRWQYQQVRVGAAA